MTALSPRYFRVTADAADAAREALYQRAVAIVRLNATITAKALRAPLGLDHKIAGALIDRMETEGVVGSVDNRNIRKVLK